MELKTELPLNKNDTQSQQGIIPYQSLGYLANYIKDTLTFGMLDYPTEDGPVASITYPDLSQGSWLIKSIRWDKFSPVNNFLDHITLQATENQSTSLTSPKFSRPTQKNKNNPVGFVFDAQDAWINPISENKKAIFPKHYKLSDFQHAAKVRFITDSDTMRQSAVVLFSDNFEARCIAQYYSRQLISKLKNQFEAMQQALDDKYQVPIVHYSSNSIPYTLEHQKNDTADAKTILNDENAFQNKIAQKKYEFLLLIEPQELLQCLTHNPFLSQKLVGEHQWHLIEAFVAITQSCAWLTSAMDKNSAYLCDLIKCKYTKLAIALIKQGNVNNFAARLDGVTPLFIAAQNGELELVDALLKDDKNNANVACSYNTTPLYTAAYNGHHHVVNALHS